MDGEKPCYTLTTVRQVIKALGGTVAVIAMTGRSPQAVSNWVGEGFIASYLFYLMNDELERRGHRADPRLWRQQMLRGAQEAA